VEEGLPQGPSDPEQARKLALGSTVEQRNLGWAGRKEVCQGQGRALLRQRIWGGGRESITY
jgi:hypothetical protein